MSYVDVDGDPISSILDTDTSKTSAGLQRSRDSSPTSISVDHSLLGSTNDVHAAGGPKGGHQPKKWYEILAFLAFLGV